MDTATYYRWESMSKLLWIASKQRGIDAFWLRPDQKDMLEAILLDDDKRRAKAELGAKEEAKKKMMAKLCELEEAEARSREEAQKKELEAEVQRKRTDSVADALAIECEAEAEKHKAALAAEMEALEAKIQAAGEAQKAAEAAREIEELKAKAAVARSRKAEKKAAKARRAEEAREAEARAKIEARKAALPQHLKTIQSQLAFDDGIYCLLSPQVVAVYDAIKTKVLAIRPDTVHEAMEKVAGEMNAFLDQWVGQNISQWTKVLGGPPAWTVREFEKFDGERRAYLMA